MVFIRYLILEFVRVFRIDVNATGTLDVVESAWEVTAVAARVDGFFRLQSDSTRRSYPQRESLDPR